MKSIMEKLRAECRSEDLWTPVKWFKVKYLGSQTGIEKDYKYVEQAARGMSAQAFTKKKRKQQSNHFLYLTEQQVSLFPVRKGECVFRVPVEKLSYSFHTEKKHYVLSIVKHISSSEVEIYLVCCKTREKLNNINNAFYFVFKDRRYSLHRDKRENKRKELTMKIMDKRKTIKEEQEQPKVDSFAKKVQEKIDENKNVVINDYSFAKDDDAHHDGSNENALALNHDKPTQVMTENNDNLEEAGLTESYFEYKDQNLYIPRQTAVVEIHRENTKQVGLFQNTDLVLASDEKLEFDRSTRRYPRSSWC